MFVQEGAQGSGRCIHARSPLGIPGQSQAGQGDIHRHEHHKDPGEHPAQPDGQAFDTVGQEGIDSLDPHHCRHAPEEAVEQVDASAEVEFEGAVIPEHRSEHHFGKDAAHIFIHTAQDGACQKDSDAVPVAEAFEHDGHQYGAQSPHDAERTVQHTAAAHPHPCGGMAVDGFDDVTQESADAEEPHQLIEAAAIGKDAAGSFLVFPESPGSFLMPGELGNGAFHTALDASEDGFAEPSREAGSLFQGLHLLRGKGKLTAHPHHGTGGGDQVQAEQDHTAQQDHPADGNGDQLHQPDNQGVDPADDDNSARTPEGGKRQADIAAEVEAEPAVIPPLGTGEAFQEAVGGIFQHGGNYGAAHKEEEQVIPQRFQEAQDKQDAHAIDGTDRAGEETGIDKLFAAHSREGDFSQPSEEGIEEEEPQCKIQRIHKKHSLYTYSQHNTVYLFLA